MDFFGAAADAARTAINFRQRVKGEGEKERKKDVGWVGPRIRGDLYVKFTWEKRCVNLVVKWFWLGSRDVLNLGVMIWKNDDRGKSI